MIYLLEFFKGASWAFLLYGAFYFFSINEKSFIYLCIGAIPGFAMLLFSFVLIENYDLKQYIKEKDIKENSNV